MERLNLTQYDIHFTSSYGVIGSGPLYSFPASAPHGYGG
jgi:hypothetical protein